MGWGKERGGGRERVGGRGRRRIPAIGDLELKDLHLLQKDEGSKHSNTMHSPLKL